MPKLADIFKRQSTVTFSKLGNSGQFGNQLFQIAVTLGYAEKHGSRPVFPKWYCTVGHRDYERYFPWIKKYHGRCSGSFLAESNFQYENLPFVRHADLYGNFQSEKYFAHIKERVADLYSEPTAIKKELDAYCRQTGLKEFNALHMRFYSHPSKDIGPPAMLPGDYFLRSFDMLGNDRPLVVAADDKAGLAQFLANNKIRKDIHVLQFDESLLDFYMLSRSRKIAISNSSFSWWAAYLGAWKERIIAPQRYYWFSPAERANPFWDTRDLYPDNFEETIL